MNLNKFRRKYRKLIDLIKPFYRYVKSIVKFKEKETRKKFGNANEKNAIYIIRSSNANAGMFSVVNTVLEHLAYADEKGYIPVIDMKNYPNSYLEEAKFQMENSWEYYFYQPSVYAKKYVSLEEAYGSKNVILSNMAPILENYHFDSNICDDLKGAEFIRYKNIFDKYIHFKKKLLADFDEEEKKLFGDRRVLGVLCRGTDYVKLKPYAHPIQPRVEDNIKLVLKKMKEWDCEYIYLATEDSGYIGTISKTIWRKIVSGQKGLLPE
ncbi:MAG: hypothetical protein V8Q40_11990 [Anaerosacchariphilus sp.]